MRKTGDPFLSLAVPDPAAHSSGAMRPLCTLLGSALTLAVLSCESTPDRRAGGAAFDEGYLPRRMDSGTPNLERNRDSEGNTRAPSYNQWRDGEYREP